MSLKKTLKKDDFKSLSYIIPGKLLLESGINSTDIKVYGLIMAYFNSCAFTTEYIETLSEILDLSFMAVQNSLFKLNKREYIMFEDFYKEDNYMLTVVMIKRNNKDDGSKGSRH